MLKTRSYQAQLQTPRERIIVQSSTKKLSPPEFSVTCASPCSEMQPESQFLKAGTNCFLSLHYHSLHSFSRFLYHRLKGLSGSFVMQALIIDSKRQYTHTQFNQSRNLSASDKKAVDLTLHPWILWHSFTVKNLKVLLFCTFAPFVLFPPMSKTFCPPCSKLQSISQSVTFASWSMKENQLSYSVSSCSPYLLLFKGWLQSPILQFPLLTLFFTFERTTRSNQNSVGSTCLVELR